MTGSVLLRVGSLDGSLRRLPAANEAGGQTRVWIRERRQGTCHLRMASVSAFWRRETGSLGCFGVWSSLVWTGIVQREAGVSIAQVPFVSWLASGF